MSFWRYGSAMPLVQRVLAVALFCLFGAALGMIVAACGAALVGLHLPIIGLLPVFSLGIGLTLGAGIGIGLVLAAFMIFRDVRPWLEAPPDPTPKKRADRSAGARAKRTEPATPPAESQTVSSPP